MICPSCGATVSPPPAKGELPEGFPFCSERCRLIDLGHWFDEDYKVSRPISEADQDEG